MSRAESAPDVATNLWKGLNSFFFFLPQYKQRCSYLWWNLHSDLNTGLSALFLASNNGNLKSVHMALAIDVKWKWGIE